MFFLALKLIKKFVKGIIWLVKLPIRITMKLAGAAGSADSRSGTETRANTSARSTTETASTGAPPPQSTTTTTERQQAAAGGSAVAAGGAAATVSAGALSKYQRFRQSILAFAGLYVLTIGWLIVDADLLAYGFGGQFVIGALINGAVPAGLWYWTDQRTKVAWGVTMGYAAIMLLLSLASTTAVTVAVPNGSVFSSQPVLALLQLASLAVLASALFFGATGRDVVGQPAAVAPEPSGADAGTRTATATSDTASAGETREQTPSTAGPTDAGGPVAQSDAGTATSTASPADDTQTAAAATSASDDDAAETGTTDTTEQATSTADPADTATATEETGGASAEDGAGDDDPAADEATDEIEPLLDSLWTEPADPETVRELGETVSTDSPSEEIIETLERCSRTDDPETRVAVCEVCGELDGPEPESILERLRIDTNDRVATTAMDAL